MLVIGTNRPCDAHTISGCVRRHRAGRLGPSVMLIAVMTPHPISEVALLCLVATFGHNIISVRSCEKMTFQLVECSVPAFLVAAAGLLVVQTRMGEGELGAFGNGAKIDLDERFAGILAADPAPGHCQPLGSYDLDIFTATHNRTMLGKLLPLAVEIL
jgi:hypothetical protein